MKLFQQGMIGLALRQVKWRLTLSYLLVTLAAIFMLAWWGLVVGVLYLQRANPTLTWLQVIQQQVVPALAVILPSSLILILPASLLSAYFGFLNARWFDQRLSNLRQATQAWQQGNFAVKVADDTADEVSAFGQELNSMAGQLARLLHARADLAALEERNHLARDLHDSVKQQITAAAFQIGSANALLEQDPPAARRSLVEAENLVHAAHQELNSILFELRPQLVQPGNLAAALRQYSAGWARQNPIQVHLNVQGDSRLDDGLQSEILRFVQEALSNIARHSQASQAGIDLRLEPAALALSIEDNGRGFDPRDISEQGFGLKTMRERIARLGGELIITSQPGHGTRLTATVPLPAVGKVSGNDAENNHPDRR